jgi:HAD superfamily hydrolase (TIGR01509 family)
MKAVFFDMDGVLTDSEPVISAAAIQMLLEHGVEAKHEDFIPYVGTGENSYIGNVARKYGLNLDITKAKARVYEIYLETVPGKLKPFPGAIELVKQCQQAGLKTAVASSADMIKVEANLKEIGIDISSFDTVVTAEHVTHPKPAPDIFLTAARNTGIDPCECCVIEDAVEGVKAAKAAGMHCIGVAQSFDPHKLDGADHVFTGINQVTLELIRSLG